MEVFETLTVAPAESNPGEISLLLIVQQSDENGKKKHENKNAVDQNLMISDFDNAENLKTDKNEKSVDKDAKSKIFKIVARKSQTKTQAHMCNYCNYTNPKRYLLSRHLKSHSDERPHKCSVCDRGFKTIICLQNHVNTHTGTKPHHCKFCSSTFTTSGELVRHVRYKHTHEKPHKCSICDYASVELSKMRNHMRCHTGERPYQCSYCTYASPDSFKLKRHLRIHTGEKPYECDICQSKFTQSNSLKAHKLIHCDESDRPTFRCDLCPATCIRKTDLRIHIQKLHTSNKLFTCRKCGKNFPDRYTFKVHNKTHALEKCWKCEHCSYSSVSSRQLESHMVIHTDKKPFICSLCDESCRLKHLLKRHQNLYHNPSYVPPPPKEKTHECPQCERAYRHKGNLIRHMCVHNSKLENTETQNTFELDEQQKNQLVYEKLKIKPGEEYLVMDEIIESDSKILKTELDNQLIESNDGEHYVVLEVLQLQDSDGEQSITMVSETDFLNSPMNVDVDGTASANEYIILDNEIEKNDVKTECRSVRDIVSDACNDISDCFAFEEEIEDENCYLEMQKN